MRSEACSSYPKYKGSRYPICGCQPCLERFLRVQARRSAELPCLFCKERPQAIGGCCSVEHLDLYVKRAMDSTQQSSGGVSSTMPLVMERVQEIRAERKRRKREVV